MRRPAMRRTLPLFMLTLALCAGLSAAQELARHDDDEGTAARGRPALRLATLTVSSIPKLPGHRASYSAVQIQDVLFTAMLSPTLQGEHRLNLRLYTPHGHLYQTLKVPVIAPPPPPPHGRRKPAPRQPIVVSARLPVAGTSIVASSLYGRWRVVPHLDDAEEPCGRALRFEITR